MTGTDDYHDPNDTPARYLGRVVMVAGLVVMIGMIIWAMISG